MQAVIRKPKPFYAKLHNQVIIAMVAAIALGAVWPSVAVQMKPLGDGFIKLIGMVIAPLVFCIIVSGISGMGNAGRVALMYPIRVSFLFFKKLMVNRCKVVEIGGKW